MKPMPLQTEKMRSLKMRSGSSGSAGAMLLRDE